MNDGFPRIMGCKFCGTLLRHEHGREWHPDKGWHGYQTPSREQIRTRWKEHMDAREAKRRQQLIVDTLFGLKQILTTNLAQELDPAQEEEFKHLISVAVNKGMVEL